MDAKRFLSALTNDELHELCRAIPAEYESRGLEQPAAAAGPPPKGADQPHARARASGAEADAAGETLGVAESVTLQLPAAARAYQAVAAWLNDNRRNGAQVPVATEERVADELAAWLTRDKLAFVAEAQEADPTLDFILVATPNIAVDAREIAAVARELGKTQRCETYVWDELYGMYTPEQLSGADPDNGNSVVLSLIPGRLDERLYGRVHHQREVLADMRAAMPAHHVPSVWESVTYWQTLRERPEQLADGAAFDATYIRHFDLPAQQIGNFEAVPSSCGGGGGGPALGYSRVQVGSPGRVAVGARAAGSVRLGE